MKLIITGSIAFDYLMSFQGKFSEHIIVDKIDRISVSFLVDSLIKRRGGCAANVAYNLALLGEKPILVGAAGKDFIPYGADLEVIGVDISGVEISEDEYTASFFCNTDLDGNQIASFYTGAMKSAGKISLMSHAHEECLIIISPNDPAAMTSHAKECQDLGLQFIYDPGQQVVRLEADDLLKGAKESRILILNDYELEIFKKKTKLSDEAILEITETLIVTMGDKGSEIITREDRFAIPAAKPHKVLDPTGVGDSFRAGLMKGLKFGLSWDVSGRMGSLAAAYVLETDGSQSHKYCLENFIERFEDEFGVTEEIRELKAEK